MSSFELEPHGPSPRGDPEVQRLKYVHRRKGNTSGSCTHRKPEEAQNVSVPQRSQKEAFPEKTFISDFWLLGPQVKLLLSFATPFVVICCHRNVLEASSWEPVESGENHVLKRESKNCIYLNLCTSVFSSGS